jgi:HSP20 family protein
MTLPTTTRESHSLFTGGNRHPLESLRQEVDDMLARVWAGGGEMLGRISPNLDLSETDEALDVRMDVPGLKPADIDIKVSGNLLTISGERAEKREEKGRTFHRVERRTGSFSRSVTLPCTVREDQIEATYKDGVLNIRLPKTDEAVTRKITVKS